MSLTIFDLDNTLLAGDSDHSWGQFLVERQLVDPHYFQERNDQFYEDYRQGCLDIHQYLLFALEPLARFDAGTLSRLHAEFMREKIAPLMLPKAQALIKHHRDQGNTLLVITATNRFIVAPIVEVLDIPNLLASEAERDGERYTGRPIDTPCFGEGKVTRLQRWLQEHKQNLSGSYFYSDSHNDLPLLKLVEHPVAVDPDPILSAHALAHSWPIISLREPAASAQNP